MTQSLVAAREKDEDAERKRFEKGISFAKAKGLSADDIKYLCQWNNYSARDNWEEVEKQLGTAKKGV